MDIGEFESRTAKSLQDCGWRRGPLQTLLTRLYSYALEKTQGLRELPIGTTEWAAKMYVVSLLLHQTPLGSLDFLEEDEDLFINVPEELLRGIPPPSRKALSQARMELEIDGVVSYASALWQGIHLQ